MDLARQEYFFPETVNTKHFYTLFTKYECELHKQLERWDQSY